MTTTETTAQHSPRASISVIVPSFNCGRFIAEALDSILAQTLQPEQIIVVDDGSTDDTAAVVGRYTDPRIRYIRKQHGGAASARNAGLDLARGEYLTFLDADDRWRPIFIEMLHAYLTDDPTAACVFSNFVRFQHATGKLLRDQFQLYPELQRPTLLREAPYAHGRIPKEQAFRALVACGEIPARTQVMMFRRHMIEPLRFDSSLVLGDDTNFALRAFMAGGVVFTDAVLAEVRQHDGNAAGDNGGMALHKLNGLKALAPHVTRESDLPAYRDRLVRAHVETALQQAKAGRIRAGLQTFREGVRVPGSPMRKLKGLMRLAVTVPLGLAK